MRGVSQSFLVRASDGACYVAKFAGNPQGNRTLINECLASHLLGVLGVATPELALLALDETCEGRETLFFATERVEAIAPGLHLGSRCPVDPNAVAIFDFLPRKLYSRVGNLDDAGIVFAFDQWVAHTDKRQFIFACQPATSKSSRTGDRSFLAWAIDHGGCFGQHWTFPPRPLYACYPFDDMYSHFNLQESAAHGAKLIESIPASELAAARQHVPREWFAAGEHEALDTMLEALLHRQQGFAASVQDYVAVIKGPQKLAS
jgi:hypothetical protein